MTLDQIADRVAANTDLVVVGFALSCLIALACWAVTNQQRRGHATPDCSSCGNPITGAAITDPLNVEADPPAWCSPDCLADESEAYWTARWTA